LLESYNNFSVIAFVHIFTLAVLLSVIYIYRNRSFGSWSISNKFGI